MTIVVCPLSRVSEMVRLHEPRRVVSLLDPELPFPELGTGYADRHLRLSFHDINRPLFDLIAPSVEHIRALLRFVHTWDPGTPMLIHCRAGISRSTAAAYIVACAANPNADEYALAAALRAASPMARPNEALVRLADDEMRKSGRMSDAIADTGRDLPWLEIHENDPFLWIPFSAERV